MRISYDMYRQSPLRLHFVLAFAHEIYYTMS